MVRLGILGFAHGHVGNYCRGWRAQPALDVAVAAGWDHDAGRLAAAVKAHDLRPAASAEELLRDPSLDAVLIASETSLHAGLVEQAAAAGRPIVLQKPLALTLPEADRIVAAVTRARVPFTLAWQMRVDPQNVRMRDIVRAGALGKVFMVRRRHGLDFCLNPAAATSWHTQARWNRDLWADDAAHPVDFLYWLLGLPKSVTAEIATLHNPATPCDNGLAIFRYPGGPLAEICCSFTNRAGVNTTEIVCEGGTIVQDFGDVPSCNVPRPEAAAGLKWFVAAERRWVESGIPSPASHGERLTALCAPLAEFLHGRRAALATAAEGRDVLRLVLATHLSSAEGRRVSPDDPRLAAI